jgi:hypothetical protein
MPKFVFEITEEEWQRFSHLLNVSSINETYALKEFAVQSFDDALKRIFLLGLYHLEHEVHGTSDYNKDGKPQFPPGSIGNN